MSQVGATALMDSPIGELDLGPSLAESKLAIYPSLCFWYGLSLTELIEMPRGLKQEFIDALPGLINQYHSLLLTASAFPHMTERGRKDVLAHFEATPPRSRKLRVVSESDQQPEAPPRPYIKPPWPDDGTDDASGAPRQAQPKDTSYEQWVANIGAVGITFIPPQPKAAGEGVAS